MARFGNYHYVIVESFIPDSMAGLRGPVHIRPLEGQGLPVGLHVECAKRLSKMYPVGTMFKIWAKLTDRDGEGAYLYSFHRWPTPIITLLDAKIFIREHGSWDW
jgi:hypothetical protein